MNRPSPIQLYSFVFASALLLEACTGAMAGTGTRVDPKAPQGALGGRIQFPQGVAPAMRICAITAKAQRCIDSPAGRTLYRIGELPDGSYQVVARVDDANLPVAGHVHEVQCIRAPCPAQLATLEVVQGKEIATADLNGFYAERPDFPTITN
jgi:hypothetical protein